MRNGFDLHWIRFGLEKFIRSENKGFFSILSQFFLLIILIAFAFSVRMVYFAYLMSNVNYERILFLVIFYVTRK